MGSIKELILYVTDDLDEGQAKALSISDESTLNGDFVEIDIKPFLQMGGPHFLFQVTIRESI